MPDVHFTRGEVEKAAGGAPWTRQDAFTAEIAPEDIAATGTLWTRAAQESHRAGDLARTASRTAAAAGTVDGTPLADPEQRTTDTTRALGNDGEDADTAAHYLARAVEDALYAEQEVDDLVHGTGGLEQQYQDALEAARQEWAAWQARPPATSPLLPPLRTEDGLLPPPGGGDLWPGLDEPAEGAAGRIRAKHLRTATEAADETAGAIDDAIETYRRRLTDYASELATLGYDIADGPLPLWTTDEMARYLAEQFAEELDRRPPDPDRLLALTEGLSAILGDPLDAPGTPPARLTPVTRAYLATFLGALDAADLAALGALTERTEGLDPGTAGIQFAAAQRVANSVMLLLDPELGGIDPTDADQLSAVPAALRPYLVGLGDTSLTKGLTPGLLTQINPPDDSYRDTLEAFNGFGTLMATADTPPGDAFARILAETAVTAQTMTQYQYMDGGYEDLANKGSTGLLAAAALNSEASAALLTDENFRDSLLSLHWEDSSGAAALVESGTTLPDGIDHKDAAAGPYVEAAYNVLSYAGDHTDEIHGDRNATIAMYAPLDHAPLERAVGDTMLRYMNLVSQLSGEGDSGFHTAPAGGDTLYSNLFGEEYRHAFELSRDQQHGLFSLMHHADDAVRAEFEQGVSTWQTTTAHAAFRDDSHAPSALQAVGRVAGFEDFATRENPSSGLAGKQRITFMNTISTAAWVAGGLAELSARAGAGVSVGAYGLIEGLRYALPDPGDGGASEAQWNSIERGDQPVRTIVAYAAQAADYANPARGETAGDYPLPKPNGINETDIANAVADLEGNIYPGYWGQVVKGFDQGSLRED
ncbi:hypothetical protein [Streptomyces avicenniae]|uniref:hypothetical protein n=1 Tax=Streptomyces avicenniae TaxID=500153 RepID=UPI00069ACC89|nr:hypothetical protein [Streptomyces avicenniae]